LEQEVA
jgi:hypothetical protein